MAAELQKTFNAQTRLIKGRDGVFEVSVDGDLVFSKRSLGRFPEPGEVAELLNNR